MATVIDSLLIELGLDSKKFNDGQKKALDSLRKLDAQQQKQHKEAERGNKRVVEGLEKATKALAVFGAVAASLKGYESFMVNLATGNAQLARTADMLKMGTNELQAWGAAAKTVGGSMEGFAGTMQSIEGGLAKMAIGQGGQNIVQELRRLGVMAKDGAVDFLDLADALKRLSDAKGKQVAWASAQNLGMDMGTFQLAMKSRKELEAMHGDFMSKSRIDGDKAKEVQEKYERLQNSLKGLSDEIFNNAAPAFEKLLDLGTKLVDSFTKFDDKVHGVASGLVAVGTTAAAIYGSVKALTALFGISAAATAAGGGGTAAAGGAAAAAGGLSLGGVASLAGVGLLSYFGANALGLGEAGERLGGSLADKTIPDPGLGGVIPRNIRNNNPGNIEYGAFAKSHGATGNDGRFAVFPSPQAGKAAMLALLQSYYKSGNNTIEGIVGKWSPAGENGAANTNSYIADVARRTGINSRAPLGPSQLEMIQQAMAQHEGMIGARARVSNAGRGGSTVTTHIGSVNVHTKATEANGIVRDMSKALKNNALIQAGTVAVN